MAIVLIYVGYDFTEEKLYTSEETASILGISLRTLYRYLKKGEIEAETKTQSGTFRFTRKQIYKYLYPDKYSLIVQKLKLSDHGTSSVSYMDDDEFKNVENIPAVTSDSDTLKPSTEPNGVPVAPSVSTVPIPPTPDIAINVSKPVAQDEATKIIEARQNKGLDDELQNLEALLGSNAPSTPQKPVFQPDILTPVTNLAPVQNTAEQTPPKSVDPLDILLKPVTNTVTIPDVPVSQASVPSPAPAPAPETPSPAISSNGWKFYVNTNKDILDLAREMNSLCTETGRKYAATMRGGLSLHHDIDEFNLVHFYIQFDDLNWFVEQLELKPSTEQEANICLIPTNDITIFDSSYKLRGLNVVSDSTLIQDLMANNEKELAKTLL